MNSHSFDIGRWLVTYRATSDVEAAAMRDRLDRMIHTELAQACAGQLTQDIQAKDPSVWLIRHLNLGMTLPADLTRATSSAQRWGEHLAAQIQTAIHRGEENDSVLHFPTRAAYVAQFARDLAAGRAGGKWYYDEFSSLLSLSVSRAIFESFANRPEQTGAVLLALLTIRELRTVLLSMTETDARQTFEAWQRSFTGPNQANETQWIGRLLNLWNEMPLRGSTGHPYRDGLWWAALALSRHDVPEGDSTFLTAIEQLLALRSLLSALDLSSRHAGIDRLAGGDLSGAQAITARRGIYDASNSLEFFQGVMDGDAGWAHQTEGVLLGESEYLQTSVAPKILPYGPAIPSRFAGVFRLGPSFLASGIENALVFLDPEIASAYRHLVAVKCIGRDNARCSFADSAMRVFSGFQGSHVPEWPTLPFANAPSIPENDNYFSLTDVIDGIPEAIDWAATVWAQAVLKHFAGRLVGFESSTPQHLFRNFLSGDGFVRDTDEKIIAELPPPTLAIVLSIAGIAEESYILPWIEGREICVRPLAE